MLEISRRNAGEYGFADRATYVESKAQSIPFADDHFDAVFTNGSLHEWENPVEVMNEIARVLKPGGRYFISDLRRDMNPMLKWFMWLNCKPKGMRPGLITSVNAAYTPDELRELVTGALLETPQVHANAMGVSVVAMSQ